MKDAAQGGSVKVLIFPIVIFRRRGFLKHTILAPGKTPHHIWKPRTRKAGLECTLQNPRERFNNRRAKRSLKVRSPLLVRQVYRGLPRRVRDAG